MIGAMQKPPEPFPTKYLSMTRTKRALIDDFIRRLVLMQNEAVKLGMYQTMHKINDAVKKSGWELAEILDGVEKEKKLARS